MPTLLRNSPTNDLNSGATCKTDNAHDNQQQSNCNRDDTCEHIGSGLPALWRTTIAD
ncbi:MAG: hypothetical protein KGJ13_06555 [Patescibacteria group bacterium]|nr:hypothetical protein [Patescibacteria group bacterium]